MSRRLKDNNLIILCEGTKTEFQYFEDIKKKVMSVESPRFTAIKIVPVENEMVHTSRNHVRRRQLQDAGIDTSICYYCLQEDSKELYDKYCAYPSRFVRETYLYMEREGYVNGWAVFDHDNHPDRKNAMRYAQEMHVKVAFSSRCFEEWLLAHFERNPRAFETSECKDVNDAELRCGTGVKGDCNGNKCLGGRLRSQSYIPNYDKAKVRGVFEIYTIPLYNRALMNAAWLRTLEPDVPIEDKRTYTDVDFLVGYLLGDESSFVWIKLGQVFSYRGTKLSVSKTQSGLVIKNEGGISCVLNHNVFYCDKDGNSISEAIEWRLIGSGESKECLPVVENTSLICVQNGNRTVVVEV